MTNKQRKARLARSYEKLGFIRTESHIPIHRRAQLRDLTATWRAEERAALRAALAAEETETHD